MCGLQWYHWDMQLFITAHTVHLHPQELCRPYLGKFQEKNIEKYYKKYCDLFANNMTRLVKNVVGGKASLCPKLDATDLHVNDFVK